MMQIEIRGDKVIIDGYVNAVGRDSRPIRCQTGDFVEQVEPGVFRKALSRAKNVDLLLNHRKDRKLGSTGDGVLTLTEDNIGLRAHAEIGDEEAIEKARNKLFRGWSFGMYVNKDNMEQRGNDIPRRHLEDIDIFEVSLIDNTMMPYYAGTSVECRAEGDALAETRAFDDTVEVNEVLPDDYYSEREKQLEQLRAESQWCDAEKRLQELRYNPYHGPTNGRFTSGSGGNGGYLFVGKGQKGKGMYVFEKEQKTSSNTKYQGISVVGTDGKTRMYIEQKGGYFSINSNGLTERLPDNMQKTIKAKGGLSKFFGEKSSPINDEDIDALKEKFNSRPSIDYELGNSFNEHGWGAKARKNVYRPGRAARATNEAAFDEYG